MLKQAPKSGKNKVSHRIRFSLDEVKKKKLEPLSHVMMGKGEKEEIKLHRFFFFFFFVFENRYMRNVSSGLVTPPRQVMFSSSWGQCGGFDIVYSVPISIMPNVPNPLSLLLILLSESESEQIETNPKEKERKKVPVQLNQKSTLYIFPNFFFFSSSSFSLFIILHINLIFIYVQNVNIFFVTSHSVCFFKATRKNIKKEIIAFFFFFFFFLIIILFIYLLELDLGKERGKKQEIRKQVFSFF